MNISSIAQAILLLTSYFGKQSKDAAKPLTIAEWARFADWLKLNRISPSELLNNDNDQILSRWRDPKGKITPDRIAELLLRGHSMALALEKWSRAGLWVITRADREQYPKRLLEKLGNYAPPVLYGCGPKELLNEGGIAVVGSRNATPSDLSFTEQLGAKFATHNIGTVSGGARGVDEAAMIGAMNAGGIVIGILADSLLRAATSAKWRSGLMNGNTVLISPVNPEAGFNKFNAMDRNKYIYCLADCAVVVHSGKKGGTVSGAEENLKKGWVPLWIKPTDDTEAANPDLVTKGGQWCADDVAAIDVVGLITPKVSSSVALDEQQDLFAEPVEQTSLAIESPLIVEPVEEVKPAVNEPSERVPASPVDSGLSVDFYQVFMTELKKIAESPVTIDGLIEQTGLHKSQLTAWLNKAKDEGLVKKLNRPVRYQIVEP
ncbi:hypothetical protein GCM10011369_16480 [Neiella marina]|uniref:Smf/DprA SLOG domain-containing protein n=1 Tax=Neiella marina TaxID=508461 RepID=A0A8J2U4L0_9GAMM|nr:DNA-processing protein DprA [Neiella marina]GGA75299.1 hypothetical protein GCM10011369_16480 [Neiella marina]